MATTKKTGTATAAAPAANAPAPRTRDAARSREAILAAARDEFAAHGLAAHVWSASPSAPA